MVGAIIMAGLLWSLSVALPVWDTRDDHSGDWSVIHGFVPALLGFLGILAACPAWFANLFLIPLAIMLFKGRKAGFILSLVALALAASAYMLPGLYGDNSEAVIEGRRIGFYLWLGSFVTVALACALLATATDWRWMAARVTLVVLMVLCILRLEKICPVGASPLETALKDPKDLTALTTVLAQHPSQKDKDAALVWALRRNVSDDREAPSKQVMALIAAGADPNQPDEYGHTLLMNALPPYGSEALVEILVKIGADVNVRDKKGNTALDIEQKTGSSPECQKFLINVGAHTSGH